MKSIADDVDENGKVSILRFDAAELDVLSRYPSILFSFRFHLVFK